MKELSQEELILWLKPAKFDLSKHIIIKAKFKYSCQLCYRPYFVGEFICFNKEKGKGRHINCEDSKVKARAKVSTKRKISLNVK